MPELNIPISKYVQVFTRFAGAPVSAVKEPIARILTTNPLAPFGAVLEITSLEGVLAYFGANSNEYAFAQNYFQWISKLSTQAKKISFFRNDQTGLKATMISGITTFDLASFKAITAGTLNFSYTNNAGVETDVALTGIDFSTANSLTDVASIITTALSSYTAIVSSVVFNPSMNGNRFVMSSTASENNEIFSFATSGVDNLADLLGWTRGTGAILSEGKEASTIVENLSLMANINDNCYTIATVVPSDLSLDDAELACAWNKEKNSDFMFVVQPTSSYANWQITLAPYTGTWIQYDQTGENHFFMPMAATANINFSNPNSIINFMYQQFAGFTPNNVMGNVGGLPLYQRLDNLGINYFASTQTAGSKLSFLQDGSTQGEVNDATIYVNSIWLKAEIIRLGMQTFILNNAIPANIKGNALITAKLSTIWTQAISNGVIQSGKILTESERATVEALTGDAEAFKIIERQGYIFEAKIQTNPANGRKYFEFRLIYAAADTIRKIEGTTIGLTTTSTQ